MSKMELYSIGRSVKMGALAGHIAAWSVVGLIMLIDAYLSLPTPFFADENVSLPTGTFFAVIGVMFGLSGPSAAWLGFVLHMVTGTVIGALFGYFTSAFKGLHIRNVQKAVGLSMITGVATWLVLFLPITVFVVQPSLGTITELLGVPILDEMVPAILGGSVAIHIIYGGMLGFMYWLAIVPSSYEYKREMMSGT